MRVVSPSEASVLLPEKIVLLIDFAPGCWLWLGRLNSDGYGTFSSRLAHDLVYEILVHRVPDNLELDHLCRIRRCVNTACLDEVPHRINVLRGDTLAASEVLRTECPLGHSYTEANTYVDKAGRRHCRECQRRRGADWYQTRGKYLRKGQK